MKHIWKIKRLLLPKRRKTWWNRLMSLLKNHRNCSLRSSAKGRLFRTFNSYSSFNFKGRGYVTAVLAILSVPSSVPGRRAVSVIFAKLPFAISPYFDSFFNKANVICYMCLVRSIIANLCQIMIHFCALDFTVCCSEEVISFFWRSVYIDFIRFMDSFAVVIFDAQS